MLTGILLDVSSSMRSTYQPMNGQLKGKEKPWIQSILKVVERFARQDGSDQNCMFALTFGTSNDLQVADLISTIQNLSKPKRIEETKHLQNSRSLPHRQRIHQIIQKLRYNGASYIHQWVSMGLLINSIKQEQSVKLHFYLFRDQRFLKYVVSILPALCKDGFGNWMLSFGSTFIQASSQDIRKIANQSTKYLISNSQRFNLTEPNQKSIFKSKLAMEILTGIESNHHLTDKRVENIIKDIQPFIYGSTPFAQALDHSLKLFSDKKWNLFQKMLFVLSDGQPNKKNYQIVQKLKAKGIIIISLFISTHKLTQPLRIYTKKNDNWPKGAKYLFDIASKIKTQKLPYTIFIQKGWTIDYQENSSRLFLQINHPQFIENVCQFARQIVCNQDSLPLALANISLDLYINQYKQGFQAKEQKGGTCYANASAAIIDLATRRIIGRQGDYPNFYDLRKTLIAKYGENGANTFQVLKDICPTYRLQVKEVNHERALKAITCKRPVLATFSLTNSKNQSQDTEWKRFSQFYRKNPKGILESNVFSKRDNNKELGGHAVVLTSFNASCFVFMNSWGTNWGDNGFFRVQNQKILNCRYYDVYWTLEDLKESEKLYFQKYGNKITQQFIQKLRSLKTASFKCPHCSMNSEVSKYKGTMFEVKCERCSKLIKVNEGSVLALYKYLEWISSGNK